MNRIVSLLILSFLAFSLNAKQFELRELLDGNNPFALRADEFVPKHKFFRWLSADREGARYAAFKNPVKLTFLGFPVLEAILYFENNQLSKLYLSLYNRGDAGEIDYGKFAVDHRTRCAPAGAAAPPLGRRRNGRSRNISRRFSETHRPR